MIKKLLVSAASVSLLAVTALGCAPTEVVVLEPLVVINVAPSHGAIDIDPSVQVIATFSRGLDEGSVDTSSASLRQIDAITGGEIAKVAAPVAYNADELTVTLTPATDLAADSRFELVLTSDITDEEGQQLPAPVTASFTTL
jgi:hypothetical protein